MNRPPPMAYLFGNSVSYVVLGLAVIISGIAAFGGAPPILPIILLAIGGYAHSAHEKIRKYNAWKSQWDEMNGEPPKPKLRPSDRLIGVFKPNSPLRYVVGLLSLLLLGFMAKAAGPGPFALFVLITIALTIGAIIQYRRNRIQATTSSAASVTVCLSVPRQSASAAQAFAALPEYCARLIGQ